MLKTRALVRHLSLLLPLLFTLFALTGVVPAWTQEDADPANPHLTAHLSNIPFAQALDLLCKSVNVTCALPDEIAALIKPGQLVNIDLTNGTFQEALSGLLDQVDPGVAFRVVNGAYILEATGKPHKAKVVKAKPVVPHGLTVSAKDSPFEDAVRNLFHGATALYRIAPSVTAFLDPVTYQVNNVPFDEALTQLLKAVPGQKTPLTFHQERGVYVITAGDAADQSRAEKAASEPVGPPSYHPLPTIKEVAVTNSHPDVPLRFLFKQPGVNYVLMLPTGVAATPRVTFAMRGVPMEQAVVHLLRSAPADPMLRLLMLNTSEEPSKEPSPQPSKELASRIYLVKPFHLLSSSASSTMSEFHHSFRFHNVSLYDALKALLNSTGTNYTLDPNLRQYKVEAEGDDLVLEKALAKLLAAAPKPIDVKTTNGILGVMAREGLSAK